MIRLEATPSLKLPLIITDFKRKRSNLEIEISIKKSPALCVTRVFDLLLKNSNRKKKHFAFPIFVD